MSVQALRYLLDCGGECEYLDFKEQIFLGNDYGKACMGKDVVGMRNIGGGYIVVGVKDKTWEPVGLKLPVLEDTKILRDIVRQATGLSLEVDIVKHKIFISAEHREFAVILVRSTAKRNKLRTPSICRGSYHPNESWGIRDGDIFVRKSDETIRISSQELEDLLLDLLEREDQSAFEQEEKEPSPFWVETGLYRLLPREYETFIGRTELRRDAIRAIEADPRIWIVNLHGPGGVGKSALASWLTYHYYENKSFDAILQLSAKDTQLTPSGIARLRPTLFSLENLLDNVLLLFGFGDLAGGSLVERRDIATTLLTDYSMLLVLDNMETVNDGRVMEFIRSLPPSSKVKVLMTSRLRTSGWELPIPVVELNFEEVKEFLRIKSAEMGLYVNGGVEGVVARVHNASGGLPLAIQWMLGQYALTGDIATATDRVRNSDSPLLEFSFRNSWAVLPADSQKALAVLSIFDEAPTSHYWASALDWSVEEVERAAAKLIEATFVSVKVDPKTGKETFHALPITLAFARNELSKMDNLELTARTRHQRHVQEMELVAAETERFSSLFDRFKVERDTEKQAVILARKAESQAAASNYDEAERLFREAIGIDPRSTYVLVSYGQFKRDIGQVGEAIRLIEEASSRCNRHTGFFVYHNLSKVYDDIRNREQVERCLRKALEYQPTNIIARHQLGVVVSRLGKYNEANAIFDELISDQLSRSYPLDTLVISYKSKIINLRKAGRIKEAQDAYKAALSQIKQHPHLASRAHELHEAVNNQ